MCNETQAHFKYTDLQGSASAVTVDLCIDDAPGLDPPKTRTQITITPMESCALDATIGPHNACDEQQSFQNTDYVQMRLYGEQNLRALRDALRFAADRLDDHVRRQEA